MTNFTAMALVLALAGAAPAGIAPPTLWPGSVAVVDCVAREAGKLARGNSEAAESVIKAADGECATEWHAVERAWELVERYSSTDTSEQRVATHRAAYTAGFAAVVAARKANSVR